jgi:hypothetical protein
LIQNFQKGKKKRKIGWYLLKSLAVNFFGMQI